MPADATELAQHLAAELDDTVAGELTTTDGYADAVQRLLTVVRTQLGMQMAWLSEFVGAEQVLRFIDADPGARAPAPGTTLPLSGSFCSRVLDGRFPPLILDARGEPEAALLDVTAQLSIGAYVGVPLVGPHGVAVGMLCAIHERACPGLSERDVAAMRLLADVLCDLQQRALSSAQTSVQTDLLRAAVAGVIAGRGRHAVLQPVVDLRTGRPVAAEGLTRFTAASPAEALPGSQRSPAQWFDDAARLGLRQQLELATAASALDLLDRIPPAVAVTVNLSPATLLAPQLPALLAGRQLPRVVVEITEHAPVHDYPALALALAPYREQGLQVAIDDAGAGYASLRHVLDVAPDVVKVDMALVRGVDDDLARQTLLRALVSFTDSTGCRLVAEGVETAPELRTVTACGVHLAQGYLLGRPSTDPSWDPYPLD